ncbi:hypothetical protein J2S53_002873 [Actinopolyspora lacussalsi]|nr:hypothetical protein [Actinopolyspora lacussalsi]
MSDDIRLPVGAGVELTMSRERAMELMSTLSSRLNVQPVNDEVDSRRVLPDDHRLWSYHALREDDRYYPKWDVDADSAVAEAFYQPVSGKAKVFLDLLIDHPGQLLSVDEICYLAGEDVFSGSRSIAGSIKGLNHSCELTGRNYPFYWWGGDKTKYTDYAMKSRVADLFRHARANLDQ